jgi:hypothetical protein
VQQNFRVCGTETMLNTSEQLMVLAKADYCVRE